jgi:hypothetical protein
MRYEIGTHISVKANNGGYIIDYNSTGSSHKVPTVIVGAGNCIGIDGYLVLNPHGWFKRPNEMVSGGGVVRIDKIDETLDFTKEKLWWIPFENALEEVCPQCKEVH